MKKGANSYSSILAEVVEWKFMERNPEMASYQKKEFIRKNGENQVKKVVDMVLNDLSVNPDSVASCICVLTNLKGAGIPVASAFLRFLDPVNHKYGVIDRNVANFLMHEIPNVVFNFEFNKDGYIKKDSFQNLLEYQRYHNWLQEKAKELELEGATYEDIDGKEQPFKPVDIEMAIFAYQRLKKKNEGDFD